MTRRKFTADTSKQHRNDSINLSEIFIRAQRINFQRKIIRTKIICAYGVHEVRFIHDSGPKKEREREKQN